MRGILVVVLASVACAVAQRFCPAVYAPLCGSDGVTYSNGCFFGIAKEKNPNLRVVYSGSCSGLVKRDVEEEPECPEYSKHGVCTYEYSPVCATNGQTYASKCMMCADMYKKRAEGQDVTLHVEHPGDCGSNEYCLPRDKSGACTYEYRPICGSDGKTYGNRCTFCYAMYQKQEEGVELTMAHQGQCHEDSPPVPAARTDISIENLCAHYIVTSICTLEYNPICTSDGVTVSNHCLFCRHYYDQKVTTGKEIAIKHYGQCSLDDFCPKSSQKGVCTDEYNPICVDGMTYPTFCVYCAGMYEKQKKGETVVYSPHTNGECEKKHSVSTRSVDFCKPEYNSGFCTREYMPVCGSDGKTYGNRCMFCFARFQKNGELEVENFGVCSNVKVTIGECKEHYNSGYCTREYMPICGSDGETHDNLCAFCYDKHQNELMGEELSFVHYGQCEKPVEDENSITCLEHYNTGICTREYMPICGSDGETHDNLCVFCYDKHQKELMGEKLSFVHDGECEEKPVEDENSITCLEHYNTGICTREYTPICGSDGETHGNVCVFCFDKHEKEVKGEKLTVAHFGECQEEEKEFECPPSYEQGICTLEYAPVCGSNGHTYGNRCQFCHARDQMKSAGEILKFNRYGEC